MVEINPLVITKDQHILALDCKMSFDNNALFRRNTISELRDKSQEDPKEILLWIEVLTMSVWMAILVTLSTAPDWRWLQWI